VRETPAGYTVGVIHTAGSLRSGLACNVDFTRYRFQAIWFTRTRSRDLDHK
jgi:hypothetical protein